MTFRELIRRSAAHRHTSNRLRRFGCLSRSLILEPLEGRLCPVLTLTTAGMAAGFSISTFVTDISPTPTGYGPSGIAFPNSGGVLVSGDAAGNVRWFPSDTDGQSAAYSSCLFSDVGVPKKFTFSEGFSETGASA